MSDADYLKCPCQKCGGHIEFPTSANGTTVNCPHCGFGTLLHSGTLQPDAHTPKKNRKSAILVIPVVLILTILTVAVVKAHSGKKQSENSVVPSGTSPQAETPKEPSAPVPVLDTKSDFVVGKISLQKTEGSGLVYAVGTLKNVLNKQRFGVKVELNLLNEQGQNIGVASDYTPVIEAGKEWQFKALLAQPGTVKVTVGEISEQ